MIFTLLLGSTALFVAGCAAYFSVFGIATLFSGSFFQVAVMASSLELGKLVATSFLYRYWNKTNLILKIYLITAVLILMGITSLGIFGYLSAAYQVNSNKFAQIDSQIILIDQQKLNIENELNQITQRIDVLNRSRISQEQRLSTMSSKSAKLVYEDIERSTKEIQNLQERIQKLQTQKTEKDNSIVSFKAEYSKAKDVGTFKFVAEAIKKPLDTVVITFICILIAVFDPLAVSLVLAFNIASGKNKPEEEIVDTIDERTQHEPKEANDITLKGKLIAKSNRQQK